MVERCEDVFVCRDYLKVTINVMCRVLLDTKVNIWNLT